MNIRGAWLEAQARRRYWQTVPLSALAWLALSAFLAFASAGISTDLNTSLQWPLWWVLTRTVLFSGIMALGFALLLRRPKNRFAVGSVLVLLLILLPRINPNVPTDKSLLAVDFEHVRLRLAMDGTLLVFAATAGWVILVVFAGTQGVMHVRTRTELELAEKLQGTLAPQLSLNTAGYEIYGRSTPSSQMGGDLLDAVEAPAAVACYIGDVAGHGIQAGVFMGMIKSSARTALLRPGPLEALLADLNRVLLDIKAGLSTYVTFACLRCREGGRIEYAVAGHGPILHYHARSKKVSQLAMEQFPLGLFGNAAFASATVALDPGDILALLTDGLPEVEDAAGEQFGLERIGEIVAQKSTGTLPELTESLFAEGRRFGLQTDDETLVFVRAKRT